MQRVFFLTFSYWLVNKTSNFHVLASQINNWGEGVKIIVGVSQKSENGGSWGETIIKHFRVAKFLYNIAIATKL